MARKRVLVIGGSLAGLFAANLLRDIGWDVAVYERVPDELAGRGAGIATHPELHEILRRCGVELDASFGVEVRTRIVLDRAGDVVCELPLPQIMTSWGRVYRLLKDRFRAAYHQGYSLERIEQNGTGVSAVFGNGARADADLLIGADGIRSTVRGQYLPDAKPAYAGYVAWRGMLEERALPASTRTIFDKFCFCLPPGQQMVAYPVAGADNTTLPGHRRYNFVWYRPADEAGALQDLLTDATGQRHDISIPPPLIRPEIVAKVRADAHQLLPAPLADTIGQTEQIFFQPIYDVESPQIAIGRVVLIGDAAYTARPHAGMGVTKAAGDAMALADALARHAELPLALSEFETKRRRFGATIVARGRHLGAYMQAQLKTAHEREMAERYREPEVVLRETAVPPPIE